MLSSPEEQKKKAFVTDFFFFVSFFFPCIFLSSLQFDYDYKQLEFVRLILSNFFFKLIQCELLTLMKETRII